MPSIHPADASYRPHTWALTALAAVSCQFLLAEPLRSRAELVRVACTLLLTVATFSLLHGRHITLQRVAALRLSHPFPQFRSSMKDKTILTASGMSVIFKMLLSTAVLSNLPLAYHRLVHGDVPAWVGKIDAPTGWLFAAVNMTVVVVCWAMVLTQEDMTFEFDTKVEDDEVPLSKLKLKGEKGWSRIASTSRRHDVWVKPVLLPNGDAVGVYEMATRLASNHPLYNPDTETEPSGPILRIALS